MSDVWKIPAAGLLLVCVGCGSPQVCEYRSTPFLDICTSAVERPSENLVRLTDSPYMGRCDGIKDGLTFYEYQRMHILAWALCGPDIAPRHYDRYSSAAYFVVSSILRNLQEHRSQVYPSEKMQSIAPEWQYSLWTSAQWRDWLSAHMQDLRNAERSPAYRDLVQMTLSAMRTMKNPYEE